MAEWVTAKKKCRFFCFYAPKIAILELFLVPNFCCIDSAKIDIKSYILYLYDVQVSFLNRGGF
jgi:hypothetical protein